VRAQNGWEANVDCHDVRIQVRIRRQDSHGPAAAECHENRRFA
jgi:hypothetical protein